MVEPLIFEITNQSAWDGSTAVDITRDTFEQEGRYYTATIEQRGALRGDLFEVEAGLQSPLLSKSIWLSREDRLTYRTTTPNPNSSAAVELEVSHVCQRRAQDS